MDRRRFLQHSTLGALGLGFVPQALTMGSQERNNPPNMILFLSDDHAQKDSGCYGNDVINTPNVDRLASEGVRFTEAYSITPTCVPSRASIYTGLGPHRHGSHENHSRIDKGIKTLPHYLNAAGYRVLLAGKTHVRPRKAYPFEYMDTHGDWNSNIVIEGSDVEHFLSSDAAKEGPFCLIIATNNPHVPWPRDNDYDPEKVDLHPFHLDTRETRKAMANYYQDVTNMDRELGRTLDLLDDNELSQNTIFMYASDHGPQFPHGKWELYDYGIKIPFIVRWPEKIQEGAVTDAMISSVDILPTLLEMAGMNQPENIDGRSFADVFSRPDIHHRDHIYATHTRDLNMNYFPIRAVRDNQFKYIWNLASERAFTNHITNSNNFKKNGGEELWDSWLKRANHDSQARQRIRFYQQRPKEELYDIQKDPNELNNLADNPEFQQVKKELKNNLKGWMERQGDRGRHAW